MKIIRQNYKGIKLVGGFQFWSNPALFDTEAAIAIVLCRPTLLDLIRLVEKYGLERLKSENDALLLSGCLSAKTHERNNRRLGAIGAAYIADGEKYQVHAFRDKESRRKFTARDGDVDFAVPGNEGSVFLLSTGRNSKDKPSFISAQNTGRKCEMIDVIKYKTIINGIQKGHVTIEDAYNELSSAHDNENIVTWNFYDIASNLQTGDHSTDWIMFDALAESPGILRLYTKITGKFQTFKP